MIDRAAKKMMAKEAMRTTKPSVLLVALVYLVIINVLSELSTRIQLGGLSINEATEMILAGNVNFIPGLGFGGSLLNLAISIMSGVIAVGFIYYCILVSRGIKSGVGNLFDMFSVFFKVFAVQFMMGIFIFLWSLLLVVPGIIASYRYSMALFILADDPSKGVMQCIRESKEMTYGYKGQLFVLDLSFIGWAMLVSAAGGILGIIAPFLGTLAILAGNIFLTPYMQLTRANYYNELSGWRPEADVIIEEV